MDKHAYLIMAHNNFYILEKLLLLLDDERNDIYLHIDRKVKNFDFGKFKNLCKKSNVYFTHKRINVIWGHHSQVMTEMLLFEMASKNNYSFYHLISGADLPLKTQDYVHKFFEDNPHIELVEYQKKLNMWDIERIKYYNLYKKNRGFNFINIINKYFILLQKRFNVNRIKNIEVYKGSNWISISNECIKYILTQKRKIKKMTMFSICADEIFLHTILKNTEFYEKTKMYGVNNLRFIDWERGTNNSPYIFKNKDYDNLMKSNNLFARKFDFKVDKEIIDRIYMDLKNKNID